ncbi:hypothetical protein D3C84_1085020 [compost metagenome]
MGQGHGVAGILQLAHQFGVGNDLSRIVAAQFEQVLEQRRFVHPGHLQDVLLDIRVDQCATDVAAPTRLFADQPGAAGIAAEIQVFVQREIEGFLRL